VHLLQNHGRDLLGSEALLLVLDDDLDGDLALVLDDIEGEQRLVVLHGLVDVLATDEALDVEDGVLGVDGGLVLGGVTDQTLSVIAESDVRRGDTVSLVVGDDLDAAVLVDTDA